MGTRPADERRIRADPARREACLTWQLEDVATKAAVVRDAWPDTIDLWPGFGPEHLASDGLHPSPAGQRLIASCALPRLGEPESRHR
jgi:lysophospholipase L1-like esterase